MMAIVPGVSALAAVPVLDEPLSLLTLAGVGAVTVGAVMGARVSSHSGAGRNPVD